MSLPKQSWGIVIFLLMQLYQPARNVIMGRHAYTLIQDIFSS
jgi:hypothetical protein